MNSFIGASIPRKEDSRLLRGRGAYVDDFHVEGMLHAAIVRSPLAHGRIRHIDTGEAQALPGVVGVFTSHDLSDHLKPIRIRVAGLPRFEEFLQLPLAVEKVRYVGEPIAVVIAQTAYLAEDAASLVHIAIDELVPILTWDQAAEGKEFVHEAVGTNVTGNFIGRGNADQAYSTAHYTRRERFSVQRHTAMPMETRGLLARWDAAAKTMTVFGATKIPFFNRKSLAEMLQLPEHAVILKVGDAGGGFGVRGEFYPEDFLIPFLARKIDRPVKWVEDRREHFMATNHARETYCDLEIACDQDGIIQGLRARVTVDLGAYARGTGSTAPARCGQFLPGPYRIPNYTCSVNAYFSNKTPAGTYRGPGRFEANFFRERLIDMAAVDLNIDRSEIRRRNLVTPSEMPFNMGKLTSYEPAAEFDSGDYPSLLEAALKEIRWDELQAIQGREVDGWYHGLGLSCFSESGAGGATEQARIRLADDGTLDLFIGATNSGQGHETVFSQVCAEVLGLPLEKIRVKCASTDELEAGVGSFHSRSAVMSGNAVRQTAQTFFESLRAAAVEYFGRPNAELTWHDGAFSQEGTNAKVTLGALASHMAAKGEFIDVTDTFRNEKRKPFSYGTNAAHVAVDPRTGQVKVLEFFALEDIGTILNPLVARGQSEGAIIQGLGGVFLEQIIYDEAGQLVTASFADYMLPTATDFPNIRGGFLNLAPAPGNPLGAKGAGEGGLVAVAGAVGNAVSAALASFDVQICELPISPQRVWELINQSSRTCEGNK